MVAVMLWWRLEDPSLLGFRRAEHNISEAVAFAVFRLAFGAG